MGAATESVSLEKSADTHARDAAGAPGAVAPAGLAFEPFVQGLVHGSPADPPDSVARSLSALSLKAPVLQRAQRLYGNRVSQQIVMRARVLQRQCDCGTCPKCQEEEEQRALQRKSASHGSPEFNGIPSTNGAPLDATTRRPLESHFQADLSDVRVQTGPQAAESATSLDALAYTAGRDIYFAAGMYAPASTNGQRLLAHEVAHVVQQSSGKEPTVALKSAHGVKIGAPEDPLETEADRAAEAFLTQTPHEEEEQKRSRLAEPGTTIQRQAAKPAAQAEYHPDASMRSNIQEMRQSWLPAFQKGVDDINQIAIIAAGDQVATAWQRIEGSYNDVPAAPNPAADQPPSQAKPADVEQDYTAARRDVMKAVSTQTFRGQAVLGKITVADYKGSMTAFISDQKAQVAWVAKDTAAAIAALQTEKLEENDQWQVIGLLRQHLNPWHFAYMQKAIGAAALDGKFQAFAEGPAKAYQTLTATTAQILKKGEVGPADQVGTLMLIPAIRKVRLLQPMTAAEVSGEIYGKADKWQVLLQPFNIGELAGKTGSEWLSMGLELTIDPSMLKPEYAAVFAAAVQAQRKNQEQGSPVLRADGDPVAAVGNKLLYYVALPSGYWPDINYEWWVENDPAAVATGKVTQIVRGPKGLKATDNARTHDTTWTLFAGVPGNHIIHCRLTYGTTTDELSYTQSVITVEQKVQIELTRGFDYGGDRPKDILANLQKDLDAMPDTPGNKTKREDLSKRIADLKKSLADSKDVYMDPIPATYISSAEKPMRLPLRLFIGNDPEYNQADRGYNLKLWDYTLQGQPFMITAQGERPYPTLKTLLATFADKCYYPKGQIAFQISPAHLGMIINIPGSETVVLPTSGPKLVDEILRLLPPDVLRAISMGALGLAVVSGLLGQEEVAVPSFELSVYLGGAAAAGELAEKLEHGQFKWDMATAMNVAELAAALLGMGGAFELTTTVQGVGRVSLTPAIGGLQKGIGAVQIGIMAGMHATEIASAVASKDKQKIVDAILHALGDAAFFIIVHKAMGKGTPSEQAEPGRDVIPHDRLNSMGSQETVAADRHGVVVAKDGRVYRCSDECAALEWLFRELLAERPQVAKQLEKIAELPPGERIPAARQLYERLQGMESLRNLSNTELADRVAKSKGKPGEQEAIQELMRREGADLSTAGALDEHGMSQFHPPVVEYIDPVSGDRLPLYYNAETGKYTPKDLHAAQAGSQFETVAQWGYQVNQLPLEARGGKTTRLDSYNPTAKEIVSRKFSQLGNVDHFTALDYLQELKLKYPSGAVVADTPLTQASGWAGRKIEGKLILEVPVQTVPVPDQILAEAAKRGITIRDVTGHTY